MLASRIRDALTRPYELQGHCVPADVSIGISIAPHDGCDPDQLLKNADMALYRSKADGRGTFRFFEPAMDEQVKARRTLELDLRSAVINGEFELHYQPVVNLERGEISACEALLRWHHPSRGMVPPDEFIPVAEETGLINPIGEWVLRQACMEAATWPNDIAVAVNLSPVQVKNQNLAQLVVQALAASGLPARRLEIEITEAVLLQHNEATLDREGRIRRYRAGSDQPRQPLEHCDHGGRRGDAGAARDRADPRLHRNAGLSLQPAAARAGGRAPLPKAGGRGRERGLARGATQSSAAGFGPNRSRLKAARGGAARRRDPVSAGAARIRGPGRRDFRPRRLSAIATAQRDSGSSRFAIARRCCRFMPRQ